MCTCSCFFLEKKKKEKNEAMAGKIKSPKFPDRFLALMCVQQIPHRRELMEEWVNSTKFFLNSCKPDQTTNASDVRNSIMKNPEIMDTVMKKMDSVKKREHLLRMTKREAVGRCACWDGINTEACDGNLIRGSMFLTMAISIAAGCWNVLGEIIVEITRVAVYFRKDETPEQKAATWNSLAHLVHWAITEVIVVGGIGAQNILSTHVARSQWKPLGQDSEEKFIAAERLLYICAEQAEYLSVMPRVAAFLLTRIPRWSFSWGSLYNFCNKMRERIEYLANAPEESGLCLVDKKLRMNSALFDVFSTVIYETYVKQQK